LGLGGLDVAWGIDEVYCTVSGLREGPIPRLEQSYRLRVCVSVCVFVCVIECVKVQQKPSMPTMGREKRFIIRNE